MIISLILSFAGSGTDVQRLYRLLWLVGGVIVLWVAAQSAYLDRTLSRTIEWALKRWTDLDTRDYQSLLRLSGKYTVKEMRVAEGGWVADRTLRECRLTEEGVIVLGINRSDGSYVGVPTADTKIHPDDTLILYGRSDALQELDQRRANFEGEQAHDRAVSDQQAHVARQEAEEQARERQRELQEA